LAEDIRKEDIVDRRTAPVGTQTLIRGLDLLDHLADGPIGLDDLAQRMGLARTTTHRLATALIACGFLVFFPRRGYQLGPKLLELGFLAQAQVDIISAAKPHLEALALTTGDTVHLGRVEHDRVLYLDKIAGRRRVEISSRVGERQPLISTGLGKALLLDTSRAERRRIFDTDASAQSLPLDYDRWEGRMQHYEKLGHAYDLEENEDQIRCVAAPIRDASGKIIAAVSVSSAAQYMEHDRMVGLGDIVAETARTVGGVLGWREDAAQMRTPPGSVRGGRTANASDHALADRAAPAQAGE